MVTTSFLPARDAEFDIFEENFSNKLTIRADELGINSAEVTSIQALINTHRASYSRMNSKRAESKSALNENKTNKKLLVGELRRLVKQIRGLKGYTPAIGSDLGIIGPEKTFKERSELKPDLTVKLNGQDVIIKFKKETTNGIRIYSRRSGEAEFTFLAVSTTSPFTDKRPKLDPARPEVREYYAYFFEFDSEIGKESDAVKVTVG